MSTLKIAWRNLGRNRKRTVIALAIIALSQSCVVSMNGLMAGMWEDMLQTITGPMVGHVQVHHKDWREERAVDLYIDELAETRAGIEALPGVRSVSPRIYSAVLAAPGARSDEPADAEPAMIIGVDIEVESARGGILESLPGGDAPDGRGVVVGKVLAKRLGLQAGETIAVIGQDADEFPVSDLFEITAVMRCTVALVNEMGIVMSLAEAGAFISMPDQAHEIIIRGEDRDKAEALAKRTAELPPLAEADVLPWREAVPMLTEMIDMKGTMDVIFVGIFFMAAAVGVANTMMMSTFERRREFGMLLSVGCSPWRIVRMVFVESLVLGLVGVVIGSVIGSAITIVTSYTGIDYGWLTGVSSGETDFAFSGLNFSFIMYPKFELRHVYMGFIAVSVTSVLASLWPAIHAARLEPVEAMHS